MTKHQTRQVAAARPLDVVIESNHRIANNLGALISIVEKQIALVRTGPALIPREDVAEVLTELVGKILSLSRLHRIITTQPAQGEIDLNHVLTEVLQEFTTSGILGDRLRINSTLGCRYMVEASQASMLTLAFAEIVTNAMKYAHPTGLPVELSIMSVATFDGGVALHIADDGVGFPDGFVERRDAGVGLKLVRSLVENAGGRLETKSNALGLSFSIRLPPSGVRWEPGAA